MFPRKKRLPRALFPAVLAAGRRLSSTHFSVVFSEKYEGYAVIIPKKAVRLSVTRHKIKRRIFAALRSLLLPAALIVFPKASAHSVSYKEIETELASLLSKTKTNRTIL